MDALQIKLCDIQGRLFELSLTENMDSAEFIKKFMNSSVAKDLDSKYNRMQWAGEEYLLEELNALCEIKRSKEQFSRETMYWTGYLYRYWSIFRNQSSKKIISIADAQTMRKNYLMFHTMDPEMAIEDLEDIYRQKKA